MDAYPEKPSRLIRYPHFETLDLDESRVELSRQFRAHRIEVTNGAAFYIATNTARLELVSKADVLARQFAGRHGRVPPPREIWPRLMTASISRRYGMRDQANIPVMAAASLSAGEGHLLAPNAERYSG
jgi:hypothetical protein